MRTLRDRLGAKELGTHDRIEAVHALKHPWCWPRDGKLEAAALELVGGRPSGAPAGHVALLSVGARSTLYRFGPGRSPHESPPLHGTAVEALHRASQLAARDLPILRPARSVDRSMEWRVDPIARHGSGVDSRLEGASFGVSMCLAVASRLLELPIATDLVASAVVRVDGTLDLVDELEAKIELVAGSALGVRRILVSARQGDVARDAVRRLGVELTVVEAASLSQAFAEAFPDLETHVSQWWSDEKDALTASHDLFRIAVEGAPRLLDWRGIASAAGAVAARLASVDSTAGIAARWEATVARAIASRHQGNALLVASSEEHLARYPDAVKLRLWAHVVQAAADRDDASAWDAIRRAEPLVASSGARHPDDLRLLGALGRAYAAVGEERRARVPLEEAVRGWGSLFAEFDSSFALSEFARVLGVLRDREGIEHLRRGAYGSLVDDPRTSTTSIAFARTAMARAFVQCGDPLVAMELLADDPQLEWGLTPSHLRQARGRWSARAMEALGEAAGAAGLREAMAREEGTDRTSVKLARLDAALFRGEEGVPELAVLRQDPEVARIMMRAQGTPGEVARAVAERYRY